MKWTLGDLDSSLIFSDRRKEPLLSKTFLSVVHDKAQLSESEARENDIAALCIVILTICSRI